MADNAPQSVQKNLLQTLNPDGKGTQGKHSVSGGSQPTGKSPEDIIREIHNAAGDLASKLEGLPRTRSITSDLL